MIRTDDSENEEDYGDHQGWSRGKTAVMLDRLPLWRSHEGQWLGQDHFRRHSSTAVERRTYSSRSKDGAQPTGSHEPPVASSSQWIDHRGIAAVRRYARSYHREFESTADRVRSAMPHSFPTSTL